MFFCLRARCVGVGPRYTGRRSIIDFPFVITWLGWVLIRFCGWILLLGLIAGVEDNDDRILLVPFLQVLAIGRYESSSSGAPGSRPPSRRFYRIIGYGLKWAKPNNLIGERAVVACLEL